MTEGQESAEETSQADESKRDVVKELDEFKNQVSELTDTFYSFLNNEKAKAKEVHVTEDKKEFVTTEDADEYGFDEKQLGFINKITRKIAEDTAASVVERYDSTVRTMSDKERMDSEAYETYEDLKDEKSPFYRATKQYIQSRISAAKTQAEKDRISNDPSLVLSSASIIHARMLKEKKQSSLAENNSERKRAERRESSIQLDSPIMSRGIKHDRSTADISEERKQFRKLIS